MMPCAHASIVLRVPRTGREDSGGRGKGEAAEIDVRLTDQTFTCAARAHVATAARRTACLHVSRAMQAARRRDGFDFTRRRGRRAEGGPRQVLPRVRPLLRDFPKRLLD